MKSWYFASESAHEFISTGKNRFKLKLVIIRIYPDSELTGQGIRVETSIIDLHALRSADMREVATI